MLDKKDSILETAVDSAGTVKIANDVVATIAGLAAIEVEGVAGMSGGVVGGIVEMLGKKNMTKGVKVEVGTEKAELDIYIIVEFGVAIQKVAQEVQESVKTAVETMTGLQASAVNIHVQGVTFPQGHPASSKPEV
ncbi:MAG: Asp23/Gls24 family envelope stress response protein [Bacillota bacterium]